MCWPAQNKFSVFIPILEWHERVPLKTAGYEGSQVIPRMTNELGTSMGMWFFEKPKVYGVKPVIELRSPP
jgi:hypothetical protein